jgi:hypothetical protein
MEKDLTYGSDVRGDSALFIEQKHFNSEWELDQEAQKFVGKKLTFFRVIHNGKQKSSHGWIDNGEIVQWG